MNIVLESQIANDLKEALKKGDKVTLSVLRMAISSFKNKKIEVGEKELTDEVVMTLLQKMARKHKESIRQFSDGGREDLVEKEKKELEVVERYLPEEIQEEELTGIVQSSIDSLGASSMADMGNVMKEVISRVAGRADGSLISRIVKEKLS